MLTSSRRSVHHCNRYGPMRLMQNMGFEILHRFIVYSSGFGILVACIQMGRDSRHTTLLDLTLRSYFRVHVVCFGESIVIRWGMVPRCDGIAAVDTIFGLIIIDEGGGRVIMTAV